MENKHDRKFVYGAINFDLDIIDLVSSVFHRTRLLVHEIEITRPSSSEFFRDLHGRSIHAADPANILHGGKALVSQISPPPYLLISPKQD